MQAIVSISLIMTVMRGNGLCRRKTSTILRSSLRPWVPSKGPTGERLGFNLKRVGRAYTACVVSSCQHLPAASLKELKVDSWDATGRRLSAPRLFDVTWV